jgi:hypothetical protein
MSKSEDIEQLAAAIAEEVYIDIAKWHLYLGNAHLHTVLAERFLPMLTNRMDAATVSKVLNEVTVEVGGGRRQLPLSDLIPSSGQSKLVEVLNDFRMR